MEVLRPNTSNHSRFNRYGPLASKIGKEACLTAGATGESDYARFLTVPEIARVVLAQPHGRHNVKNEVADALIVRLAERILELE